jgi:hypothetical protein
VGRVGEFHVSEMSRGGGTLRLSIRAMKRYGHGTLRLVTTGHSRSQNGVLRTLCRWSMLSCSRQTLGGKRLICFTAAWIAGSSPAMTKERTNEKDLEAKRRQTQGSSAVASATAAPASGRRTSIGVPPRFSSQGVFHRKGLSTRLLLPGTWRPGLACPSSGRYPLLPVPVQRGHRAPVVVPRG